LKSIPPNELDEFLAYHGSFQTKHLPNFVELFNSFSILSQKSVSYRSGVGENRGDQIDFGFSQRLNPSAKVFKEFFSRTKALLDLH
jgi:hypothetical protein